MNLSNLVSAVIVASLLIGNVACACDKVDLAILPDSHHQHDAHHQHSHEHSHKHQGSDQTLPAPCDHQNCASCTSLESSCASLVSDTVYQDRETRLHPVQKDFGLDSPDLDHAPIDAGQPRASPHMVVLQEPYEPPLFLLADTPIQRKDQLTE